MNQRSPVSNSPIETATPDSPSKEGRGHTAKLGDLLKSETTSSNSLGPQATLRRSEWTAELKEVERVARLCAIDDAWAVSGVPKLQGQGVKSTEPKWDVAFRRLQECTTGPCVVGLLGPVGTGKTQMAVELIRFAIRQYADGVEQFLRNRHLIDPRSWVRFITAKELFDRIKSTFSEGGHAKLDLLAKFQGYRLLVIDELSVAQGTETDHRELDDLINKRYEGMVPTVILSNHTREGFATFMQERAWSRLTHHGFTLIFDWDDFRKPSFQEAVR